MPIRCSSGLRSSAFCQRGSESKWQEIKIATYREREATVILDKQLLDNLDVLLLGLLAIPALEPVRTLDNFTCVANPLVAQMGPTASDLARTAWSDLRDTETEHLDTPFEAPRQ